jgi:hypothetical protein
VVAWTSGGDEKNVDAWLRGRVEAIKKRWSFDGKEKTMVIRWERESNGHSMGKKKSHSMEKGEDAWLRGRVEAIKKT